MLKNKTWLPIKSKSEARRLLREGAIKVDGKVIDENFIFDFKKKKEYIIQRGKRYFLKVIYKYGKK